MKFGPKRYVAFAAGSLVLIATFTWFVLNPSTDQEAKNSTMLEEPQNTGSIANAQREYLNSTGEEDQKQVDAKPDHLVADFTYINSEYLKTNWQIELGCYTIEDPTSAKCEHPELSANSYEEALWMAENGYPTASELRFLESLSNKNLLALSMQGQFLPTLILGERAAESGDQTNMYSHFLLSKAQRLSPYSLRKMADSLVASAEDSDNPQWTYRRAAVDLKTAELLGDYQAGEFLDDFYHIVWGDDPSTSLIVSVNDDANLYLSRRFGTIKDLWPVTPRPKGG
ncbi:MAG: hypothetical protein WBN06_08690 [Lysobacterales bacterium]